jgi:hypothetical protein
MEIGKSNKINLTLDSSTAKTSINTNSISTYDILLCFIAVASVIGMLLLCFRIFNIPIMLSITAGIIFTAIFILLKKIQIIDIRFLSIFFVIIIIFAVIFRTGSFTHYQGGQDQGLYVSMSEAIVRDKSVDFYDSFGASLPQEEVILDNYRVNLSGASNFDSSRFLYQIEFYPLNAVWMAVFKFIFGMGNHGFAIKFFSILVVIGVYLLTLELTSYNYKTAYIACLFAAINPAFVFFSKFPVSETLTMAFSVNGFYFLLRAVNCDNRSNKNFFYLISALLLGMFNFIRMSFLLYLPTLAIIFIIPFVFIDKRRHQKHIFFYVSGVIGLFVSSWLWYYFYQPGLFMGMAILVFIPFLKSYKYILILALFIFIVILFFVKKYIEKIDKFANRITQKAEHFSPHFLIFILALSAFKIIQLCIVGYSFDGNTFLDGNEFFNFRFSSLYRLIQVISPFLFILLFLPPLLKIKFNRVQTLLIITVSVIWAAILSDRWCILYLYYYARYIVSDMLLYSIILVSIILGLIMEMKTKNNKPVVFIIVCAVLYSCVFSGVQIGRAETEVTQLFQYIAKNVNSNDVILSFAGPRINTPIKYYFNKPLYQLNGGNSDLNTRIINKFWDYSGTNYSNIYIMTTDDYSYSSEKYGLELQGSFNYKERFFSDTLHEVPYSNIKLESKKALLLPTEYKENTGIIYFYKMKDYYSVPILLPVPNVMPSKVGESIITSGLYDHNTFNISNKNRNNHGYLVSLSDEQNVLVYGPYQHVNSGSYQIEYSMDLPEHDQKIELATIKINARLGKKVFITSPVNYGNENIIIDFEIDRDYEDIEICLITYVSGVVFKGYTITKIK